MKMLRTIGINPVGCKIIVAILIGFGRRILKI
jgi:hypothetical protein